MQQDKESIDQLNNSNYKVVKSNLLFFITLFLFISVFLSSLNLEKTVNQKLTKILSKNRACPTTFKSLEISFFIPKVTLNDVVVSKDCAPFLKEHIKLKDMKLSFRGLSFFPFGVKTNASINLHGNDLTVDQIFTTKNILLRGDDLKFNISKVSQLFSEHSYFSGILKTSFIINQSTKTLKDITIKVISDNLMFNKSTINFIEFPKLDLNDLNIKIKLTRKNKIVFDQLVIGNKASDIRVNLKGDLSLNNRVPELSIINLKGEFFISEKILNELSYVRMFLSTLNKNNNFYQVNISGNLKQPNIR